MKEIYDKKFVHFEWDDMLNGKKVAVSDLVSDIRQYVNSTTDTLALVQVRKTVSDVHPFGTDDSCYRFCYYDPLLEYKIAYNAGKQVEYDEDVGDGWFPVYDAFDWRDSYQYRIVEEKKEQKRLTYRRLAHWLAQGYGEIKHEQYNAVIASYLSYYEHDENKEVSGNVKVRKWTDTEWHEPTVEYCFTEQGGEK